jgi:hypothetical protein
MIQIWLGTVMIGAVGCLTPQPSLNQESARIFPKEGSSLLPNGQELGRPTKKHLYTQDTKVLITPNQKPNESGSLFNLEDDRNYLFLSRAPLTVGRYADIKVVSNRKPTQAQPPANQNPENPDNQAPADQASDEDLFKDLPDLEPADRSKLSPLKSFKMRITQVFENGDVLGHFKRSSDSELESHDINVQGRIPYHKIISGNDITTGDLMDVRLVEVTKEEVIERNSIGWDDEYTARISGFHESKSKAAAILDEKRRQLQSVKDRLTTRLQNLSKERSRWVAERNKLMESSTQSKEVIDTLNQTILKKDEEIAAQQQKIKEQEEQMKVVNNPDEKPGENPDAEK